MKLVHLLPSQAILSPGFTSHSAAALANSVSEQSVCQREGQPALSNPSYRQHLQAIATVSPRQLGYPFRRWTISWLSYHLSHECGIQLSDRQIGQALRQLGIYIQSTNTSPQDWMPPSSRVVVRNLEAEAG